MEEGLLDLEADLEGFEGVLVLFVLFVDAGQVVEGERAQL